MVHHFDIYKPNAKEEHITSLKALILQFTVIQVSFQDNMVNIGIVYKTCHFK